MIMISHVLSMIFYCVKHLNYVYAESICIFSDENIHEVGLSDVILAKVTTINYFFPFEELTIEKSGSYEYNSLNSYFHGHTLNK